MPKQKKTPLYYLKRDFYFYLLLLPALIITVIFAYFPMPGILMAFQKYDAFKGIWGSTWVGLDNIKRIFTLRMFSQSILNTLLVSILNLVAGFPAPIILALLINEIRNGVFKRVTQTMSYLPHFLSWISVVGLVYVILGSNGIVNDIRVSLFGDGTERISFLANPKLFLPLVVGLGIWKEAGWGTVVHLASISSINPELFEAARVDGASNFKQVLHITLPHMVPTIVILLIFRLGGLFGSNFELIYGLSNPFIDFDVISTVVFKAGIQQGNYSMATAVGFVQGLIAFLLTAGANAVSKRVSDVALW